MYICDCEYVQRLSCECNYCSVNIYECISRCTVYWAGQNCSWYYMCWNTTIFLHKQIVETFELSTLKNGHVADPKYNQSHTHKQAQWNHFTLLSGCAMNMQNYRTRATVVNLFITQTSFFLALEHKTVIRVKFKKLRFMHHLKAE